MLARPGYPDSELPLIALWEIFAPLAVFRPSAEGAQIEEPRDHIGD